MGRFVSDQNKVLMIHESGTYSVVSGNGYWIGQVSNNDISDEEGKIEDRYLGANTRSFVSVTNGPRDVKGTISFYPQDMRFLSWAIGSVVDVSGTNSTHLATQIQNNVMQSPFTSGTNRLSAPISFTLEDSKTSAGTGNNFIRTINGCVIDSMRLIASQGEKVNVEVDYIGQTLNFTSGNTTSVTALTNTPYLWNNCSLVISGTTIQTAKEITFEVSHNMEAPHYLNGSRDISVPFPKNRDNRLSITLDLSSPDSALLYNLYKNNSMFNSTFDLNADSTAGSQHTIISLSGCYVNLMSNPSALEGPVESTVDIICPIVIGSVFDRVSAYNPW
jgi:hypothetical protein